MPSNGLTGSLAERQAVHQHSGALTPRHGHAVACHLAVQRSTTMVFLVEDLPKRVEHRSKERSFDHGVVAAQHGVTSSQARPSHGVTSAQAPH